MRRIGLCLGIIILLSTLAMAVSPTLKVGEASISGSSVSIPIELKDNGLVVSLQFDLSANSSCLDLSNVTFSQASTLSNLGFSVYNSYSNGRVRFVIVPPLKNPMPTIPDGLIVTINAKLNNSSCSNVKVKLDNVYASDSNGKKVNINVVNGMVGGSESEAETVQLPTKREVKYVKDISKAPIKFEKGKINFNFQVQGQADMLVGVISCDFKKTYWIDPNNCRVGGYSHSGLKSKFMCRDVQVPVDGGYVFWLISPVDVSELDFSNGVYELGYYSINCM